jgi:hypothetical protein
MYVIEVNCTLWELSMEFDQTGVDILEKLKQEGKGEECWK